MFLCWHFSCFCSVFGLGFTFFEEHVNILLSHEIFHEIALLSEIFGVDGFIKLHGGIFPVGVFIKGFEYIGDVMRGGEVIMAGGLLS